MRRTDEEIVVAALVIDFNKGGGVGSSQLALNEIYYRVNMRDNSIQLRVETCFWNPLSLIIFVLQT